MTKKEFNKLKKSLPKGYREMLVERLNCSISLVDTVLAGKSKNVELVKAAIDIAKAHREELLQLSTEIQKL